jgi:hypothetical protein
MRRVYTGDEHRPVEEVAYQTQENEKHQKGATEAAP